MSLNPIKPELLNNFQKFYFFFQLKCLWNLTNLKKNNNNYLDLLDFVSFRSKVFAAAIHRTSCQCHFSLQSPSCYLFIYFYASTPATAMQEALNFKVIWLSALFL